MERYRLDPVGYCREVLGISLWGKQEEIANALIRPPFKVLAKASHSVGKSFVAAALVSWWFDTRKPGVVLTTAPTARQVRDILWKEIRVQRAKANLGGFVGPKMPRLEDAPDHFAYGFTAAKEAAFQGQHEAAVLIIVDEAVGVSHEILESAKTMLQGKEYACLCIFNPTDTTSQVYLEENSPGSAWTTICLPATEHPNLAAEVAGLPPPFPKAIRLGWFEERLQEWCQPVALGEQRGTDIEWPPASGKWWRPGPVAEARLLGRWPSAGTYGVWSDLLFSLAEKANLPDDFDDSPQIGCDVARYGDDWTCIHSRWGPISIGHESANGWSITETAGRIVQIAQALARLATKARPPQAAPIRPEEIPVKVDDDGVGGGVVDILQSQGFNVHGVNAGSSPRRGSDYPNRRSELWFSTASLALAGRLDLSRLEPNVRARLKQQAMAPEWHLDAAGRRVVEPKDETKKKVGRSPDDMDALNLAYCDGSGTGWLPAKPIANPNHQARPEADRSGRKRILGR